MKKYLIACVIFLGLKGHALPVGNPAEPMLFTNHLWFPSRDFCDPCQTWRDFFNVRLGFYGNYALNRRLEVPRSDGVLKEKRASVYTDAGELILNICNRVDLFGTLGVTTFGLLENSGNLGMANVYYSPTLSYSGGVRATLWRCKCFYLGVEGEYFYTKPELDSLSLWNRGNTFYFTSPTDRNETYGEWQVALAASYQFIDCANFGLIPYAAVQFAGVKWTRKRLLLGEDVFSLKEQQVTGWTFGVTAILCNIIDITAEGRWANEKAFAITGQISF